MAIADIQGSWRSSLAGNLSHRLWRPPSRTRRVSEIVKVVSGRVNPRRCHWDIIFLAPEARVMDMASRHCGFADNQQQAFRESANDTIDPFQAGIRKDGR